MNTMGLLCVGVCVCLRVCVGVCVGWGGGRGRSVHDTG